MFCKTLSFNQDFYNLSTVLLPILRYVRHVACRVCGPQNPVSALNSNTSSLPPLQCDHFVTTEATGISISTIAQDYAGLFIFLCVRYCRKSNRAPSVPILGDLGGGAGVSLQFKLTKAFFLCDRYATAQIVIRL
jgi:hypothetical protein